MRPEIQARFQHDPSLQSYAYLYKLGIKYRLNNRWRLGSTFRVTDDQGTDEILTAEIPDRKRYTVEIYAQFPHKNDRTTIENRLRYQISQTKKLNYDYYLRYRLGIEYKLKKNIKTSVSNEIYLECPDLELPLNKTSLDVEFRIIEGIGVEIFYTIESNLQPESFIFNYIIGLSFEINPFEL